MSLPRRHHSSRKRGRREQVASSNEGELLNETRNPMLNPVVLTRLFELCDLADIPELRLVSKLWYSLSLTRFRKEMILEIHFPELSHLECSETGDKVENRLDLDTLCNQLDFGDKPFKKLRIFRMEFGNLTIAKTDGRDLEKMYKNMDQFWRKFGSSIRQLELRQPQVHSVLAFKKAIFEDTPNLEELHLIEFRNDRKVTLDNVEGTGENVNVNPHFKRFVVKMRGELDLPVTWSFLFRHFPNIQDLEVTPCHGQTIDGMQLHFTEISNCLKKKKDSSKFTVTALRLTFWSRDPQLSAAIRLLQIPLMTLLLLQINIEFEENCDEIRDLLSTAFLAHGHTLKQLNLISRSRRSWLGPFDIGLSPCLTSLDLRGNCFPNLHFLEHFPNLEHLTMHLSNDKMLEDTDSARMAQMRLGKLDEFHFYFKNYVFQVSGKVMKMLTKLMPNVESFYGNLTNSSLRVICREWRKLTELCLDGVSSNPPKFLTDEGITGIVPGREERMPNITDLTELEYLYIASGKRITDVSVWNGFLKLPRLRNLSVELTHETSDEAIEALTRQFPRGHITRGDRDDRS